MKLPYHYNTRVFPGLTKNAKWPNRQTKEQIRANGLTRLTKETVCDTVRNRETRLESKRVERLKK